MWKQAGWEIRSLAGWCICSADAQHTHPFSALQYMCCCTAAQLQWGSCRRVQDVTYLLLSSVLRVSEEKSPSVVSHQCSVLPCVPAISSLQSNDMPGRSHYIAQDYTMKSHKFIQISLMRIKTKQVSKKRHVHIVETTFNPIRSLLCFMHLWCQSKSRSSWTQI